MFEPKYTCDLPDPSSRDWKLIEMSANKTVTEPPGKVSKDQAGEWVWVTRIGSILVILTVLAAIVLYVVRAEVDSRLGPILTDTGKNTQAVIDLEKRIAAVSERVDKIPIQLSKALVDQSAQHVSSGKLNEGVKSLILATGLIKSAKQQKLDPGAEYFRDISKQLNSIVHTSTSSEIAEQVHRTFTELATYRSAVEPPPDTTGPRKPINTSIRTTISMRYNVRILFGATIFPVYVHGDVFTSTAPPLLSSNVVISGPAVFIGMVPDASQTLDGIHWIDGVTFINMRIRYNGGETELNNVWFVNCTFEFANNPRGVQLASAIATTKEQIAVP